MEISRDRILRGIALIKWRQHDRGRVAPRRSRRLSWRQFLLDLPHDPGIGSGLAWILSAAPSLSDSLDQAIGFLPFHPDLFGSRDLAARTFTADGCLCRTWECLRRHHTRRTGARGHGVFFLSV